MKNLISFFDEKKAMGEELMNQSAQWYPTPLESFYEGYLNCILDIKSFLLENKNESI